MTTLHERIETTLPIEEVFAYVADFANSQEWDPGVATARAARRRARGARGAASGWASGMGGRASPRWSTGSRTSNGRRGSSSSARAPASPPSTRSDSSVRRPARGSTTAADIRLGGILRLVQPFLGRAPSRRIGRNAADGMQRTLEAQATAARQGRDHADTTGGTQHEGRHRRRRRQRPDRGIRAPRRHTSIRLFDGECARGRPRQDGRGRDADGPVAVDTGFIVYNEHTYPRFIAAAGGTRRADAAQRHVARVGLPGLRHRVQLARACAAIFAQPEAAVRPCHWRMIADIAAVLPRGSGHAWTRGVAVAATLGDFLDDGGYGRGLPRHFLVPDHVRGVVDGAEPDPRLPDRLPAPLPRPPRPHRLRQRPPVANDPGRLDALRRSDRRAHCPQARCGPGDPVVGRPRDADAASTVRTADGARERFDAVVMATHADEALRPAPRRRRRSNRPRSAASTTSTNEVVLHTDERVLPRRRGARASWNVDQARLRAGRATR